MNRSDDLSLPRLRYVQALAIASLVLAGIALLTVLLNGTASGASLTSNVVLLVVAVVLSVLWLALARRAYLSLAIYGILAMMVAAALLAPPDQTFLLVAILTLVTAATLAGTEGYVIANVLVIGRLLLQSVLPALNGSGSVSSDLYSTAAPLITMVFISLVTRYFTNAGERAVGTSRNNADLLQATSDVGQTVSQILDLDELLERAVELISARFKHYHVQIFLVNDSRDQAMLLASTGEIGKQLLERGHQLSVGSQSVIGQVVLRGAPVLVNDTGSDPIYYRNELLLNTRAELALPIRDGALTIGALDVQSIHVNAFGRADLQALQIVADLLATAIRNARLFRQQSKTMEENERLYRDADTNLSEIQRLNQQLTRIAWQNYHTESGAATGVTLEYDNLLPASEWSDSLLRAGQEGQVVEGDSRTVAVPVMLRGEVIGAIEVEAGTESRTETLEMVQAVAQRLALSLENARLYEATLQAAAQEQRINDIAARFQSVATVDELLRVTLAELSETLGAEHGSIRLGRLLDDAPNGQNGSGSHD